MLSLMTLSARNRLECKIVGMMAHVCRQSRLESHRKRNHPVSFDLSVQSMTSKALQEKSKSLKERRDWLIQGLREHLVPALISQGFELAPLPARGPIDRELVLSLPLGRLRRSTRRGVDLIEIQFAKYRRAAFRIAAGVAPRDGLMTFTGHWPAEDVYVGWLNEYFVMYAFPRWRVQFSVWHWPHQSPTQGDYDKLALRVAGFIPELELALREGRTGPHMRLWVIPRPPLAKAEKRLSKGQEGNT